MPQCCLAVIFVLSMALSSVGVCQETKSDDKTAAKATAATADTELGTVEKASRFFGFQAASELAGKGIAIDQDVDLKQFMVGFKMAIAKKPIDMSQEELQSVFSALQKIVDGRREKQAVTNKAEGDAFRAEFAKKEGVKKLEDGISYRSLKAGTGATPKKTDRVRVHYEGRFTNGEIFDTSLDGKGEPIEFGVSGVVEGFSKALQNMKVGDKWEVAIRGDKAYGMNAPPALGPNRTLIFQIELIGIVK